MVFAPAMGIAALQVLGGLCAIVAGLLVLLILKQFVSPNPELRLATTAANAGLFAMGAVACFWGARKLRDVAGGQ